MIIFNKTTRTKAFLMLLSVFLCLNATAQERENLAAAIPLEIEQGYGSLNNAALPEWAREMYAADPNLVKVEKLYVEYYKTHEFVKNAHTQYFKRWTKVCRKYTNEQGLVRPPTMAEFDKQFANLEAQRRAQNNTQQRTTSAWGTANWIGIGPFDFDKDAAGRSHAPGAAHVYTLEKSPSNPDILYCGTANAGIWKTIDRGESWTCLTWNLPINYCNAVEIHPTDPNIALFGANGRVYKTTDGGTTWNTIGDAAFNTLSHDIDDMAFKPGDANTLFICSNKGFYRSTDGGANFKKILSATSSNAYFSELEFKPDDANTLYVVQSGVNDLYTQFYKSIDGGTTFTLINNWPVIAAATTTNNQFIHKNTTGTNYASFGNDNLGTATNPDFTIEMRMRLPTTAIADKSFLSNKNWSSGANNGWVLGARYTGNQLTFNMGNGTQRIDLNTGSIWDDNWHQISVVYRANGSKELYKDGVLATSTTTNITLPTATGLPTILGYDGVLTYGGQEMSVDEIRVFNTPLSAATVNTYKNANIDNTHPNFTNLLHYYKCDEPNGTTLIDAQANGNATITGVFDRDQYQVFTSTSNLTGTEHQKRAEISVTADKPNRVYALLSGAKNGGEGLYGVYVSDDAGLNWTHKCCGAGAGGAAVATPTVGLTTPATNANILGYSETGSDEGGQYYYDLAMDADPHNGNKVHIAGINHWYSLDGGTTFNLGAKWSWPADPKYVHADIHGIHIYDNEVWINNDGGIFMSPDSGKVSFNKKQYGIQGTDFWGFGMGHKDANVMLGGTYHNSHLMKNNNVYLNGWVSYTGSADGNRGYVNPVKNKTVYNDSGKDVLPNDRTLAPVRNSFSKLPNTGQEGSKIVWDPRCYNCLYTGNGADIWYSEDDGNNFTLVKTFPAGAVGDIEVAWDNPNIIYAAVYLSYNQANQLWKTTDKGLTWNNITPALGYSTSMTFDIAVGENSNDVWIAMFHQYNWYSSNNNKVFHSTDGGSNWISWNSAMTNNQSISNIVYQRGTNGGVYLGTSTSVLYRNKSMADWQLFDNGLPKSTASLKVLPWYREGKIRNATNRSVYESNMYELGQPHAQAMADKLKSYCSRDTVFLADYSAHYKTGANWTWSIVPAPAYISSTTVENPRVVFGANGTFAINLTVSDSMGSSTRPLIDGIVVASNCEVDTIPGNALEITASGQYAAASKNMNLNTNTMTLMAWVKPAISHNNTAGLLFFRGGTTTTGINFGAGNKLAYHWNDGQYNFNSNLILPVGEWSHVALVVEPTRATLYLNGKAATNTSTHAIEAFDSPLNIGRDPGYTSRNFQGLIDEASVYNRSLTQNEVREQMHFVKKPSTDPNLLAYYQFNETNGKEVLDRSGLYHLTITNATRTASTAPFGTGLVARQTVNTSGAKVFGNTGLSMTFPAGTLPNGELTVSRLYRQPDALPTNTANSPHYWIVNNYGTNATFSPLTNLTFNQIGSTVNNDLISLYKRRTGQDGATWGSEVANFTTTAANQSTNVTFPGSNVSSFSQFSIAALGYVLPVEWLSFDLNLNEKDKQVQLFWQTASERNASHFEIERSNDGINFEQIGRVKAKGNTTNTSSYEAIDAKPYIGMSYYRIRQVDFDGKFTFSSIKSIFVQALHDQFTIQPNLIAKGNPINIYTELNGYTATATDTWGRTLFTQPLQSGNTSIPTDKLAAGTYFIRIFKADNACLKKIVVQ